MAQGSATSSAKFVEAAGGTGSKSIGEHKEGPRWMLSLRSLDDLFYHWHCGAWMKTSAPSICNIDGFYYISRAALSFPQLALQLAALRSTSSTNYGSFSVARKLHSCNFGTCS